MFKETFSVYCSTICSKRETVRQNVWSGSKIKRTWQVERETTEDYQDKRKSMFGTVGNACGCQTDIWSTGSRFFEIDTYFFISAVIKI